MTEEKYNCIICNKENKILIAVISNIDAGSIFYHNRGVCQDCLLKGDLNQVCKEFQLKKLNESVIQARNSLKFYEDEKTKLVKALKGEKLK